MNDRQRLEQLRDLVNRLERMPASRHRDHMIAEVRARAVDVESGVRPAPIRALKNEDEVELARQAAPAEPKNPTRADDSRHAIRTRPDRPAPAPARPRGGARPRPVTALSRVSIADVVASRTPAPEPNIGTADFLEEGGVLNLDELSPSDFEPRPHGTPAPWARGLRG